MKLPFFLRMAAREISSSRSRLILYGSAVTVGVAALVAINSFRENVVRSVSDQARTILGADLELRHRSPFPDSVAAAVDSLVDLGYSTSRLIRFASMVYSPQSERPPRLLQVMALEGGYPFYGQVTTRPTGAWRDFRESRSAVVDEAVLVYLDASIGDTLRIGEADFEIAGSFTSFPGDLSVRVAVGPRVFIPRRYVEETALLRFGSLASHRAYFEIDDHQAINRFLDRYGDLFDRSRVGFSTVADVEQDLSSALSDLSRFLGLIGLVALLLGGIGVGSAVHVFVKERNDTIAVLRCMGASQALVLLIYTIEALVLGLGGAAAGALLGIATQAVLPRVLSEVIPLSVEFSVDWASVLAGLAIGGWISLAFALLPLLRIRDVSPLQALRRDFTAPVKKLRIGRKALGLGLGATVVAISVWQAPDPASGFGFAGGIAAATGLLVLVAAVTVRYTRRFFPRRARYTVRQGIANLFRPQNQTIAVTLGIGFGVFLLATLYLVQRNLLDQIALDSSPDRPNLAMFDIQSDQIDRVTGLLDSLGVEPLAVDPIVPARIAAVNGTLAADLLADSVDIEQWMLRREYRNTFRSRLSETEEITAGQWWPEAAESEVARISLDEDIAEGLGLDLGDRITWDIQGVQLESEIVSLRRINWARLATNYFVVFEPGALAAAPTTYIYLARVEDPALRAVAQREVIERAANVSMLDLTNVQQAIDGILDRISLAIRFMALFSIASGLIVLVGAIATTRYQRLQESALLKTLGATARQIREILFTEYLVLGLTAGVTGSLLASGAGWAVSRFLFEVPFSLPVKSLAAATLIVAAATVTVGLLNSRGVIRHTPLATIRQLGD